MRKLLIALAIVSLTYINIASSITSPLVQRTDSYNKFEVMRGSTYQLLVDENQDETRFCSAVAIADGYAITAKHCVSSAPDNVVLGVKDHNNKFVGHATIVRISKTSDSAILAFDFSPEYYVSIGPKNVPIDTYIYVVGYPFDFPEFLTEGKIQGFYNLEGEQYYVASAPASFGNSGGGLFAVYDDGTVRLIGITSWGAFGPYALSTHMTGYVQTIDLIDLLYPSKPITQ